MFNHAYFVGRMRKLLDALKKQNIDNTIIIMDNAKYHKNIPDDTPHMGWKKEKLLGECSKQGIQVPYKSIKTEVRKLLEPFIRNTLPIICAMAKAEGHEVIFSPPHYSDLQPINIMWVNVKGEVGQKYTTQTTFKDVLVRLKESFTNLESQTVQGRINQASQCLKELHQHIINIDDDDEDEYSDVDIYVSDTDGNNNVNDDSSDGEVNDYQQVD